MGSSALAGMAACARLAGMAALALSLAAASACNNLGFVSEPKAASLVAFAGVKSMNVTPDGRYILFWDHAGGVEDVSSVTYEVYMDKWDAMPSSLAPSTAGLDSTKDEGRMLGTRFAEMPDTDAPITKGILLSSVKGVRSYALDEKIQANVIYAFQVRVVSPDGKRDDNLRVMIYSAAENKIAFTGASGLEATQSGKLLLSWDPPSNLPKDIAPGDVAYEIYMDSTPDDVATVAASGTIAIRGASLTDGSRLGQILDLPAERLPAHNAAPLGSQKGGRSYEIGAELSSSLTYIFQVKARGPGGEPGDSPRVVVYRRGNLSFAGLQQSGAVLSDDFSKITLSWDEATDAIGPVSYTVYSDANFTTPLATTMETSYEFQDLSPGMTYTFAVRAQDSNGPDTNRSFAVVKVGAINFAGLQQSGISLASDNSAIVLTWTPATNAKGDVTYVVYEDSTFSAVLGQTPETTFAVQNPAPGKLYTLGVRAKDSNGFDDNTSFAVVRVPAMTFAGLQQSGVALAADNSKIELTWTTATNAQGPVTYVIYQDSSFSSVLGQTTQTSYTINTPTPGKQYTLAVRAKDANGFENNTQIAILAVPDLSDRTPPDFTGLSVAETVSDTKILLHWDASPSSDVAVYNVYYAHDLTKPIASTSSPSHLATGLTAATSYAFIVRAKDTSGNEENNSIQKSAMTLSYAVPNFSGIDKIENLGGVDGLTKLKVSWLPAGGTVTGYQVYKSTTAGGEDFSLAEADIVDSNATSATITGLASDTMYYFVVRAYDNSSGTARFERNTIEKALKTVQVKAPTFAGVASATPGEGGLGFTTAKATWGAPQADGVYDGFVVEYEVGTCAQGFSGSPQSVDSPGDATRNLTITGLTAQTTYRIRVRTRYSPTGIKDANTACKEAYTSPPPPLFAGVSSVTVATGISGFISVVATWPQATSSFSYYKVEWSTASNFGTIGGTSQVAAIGTLTKTITGLPAKTLIHVRVSAVFDESGVQLSAGETKALSAKTEPPSPTGEGASGVTVLAADSLKVAWTAPTNAGSVYNGYKLWKYCGSSAPNNLLAKLSGAADHTYPTGQLNVTFTGLSSNVECCYQVRAYYDDGTNTLASQSTLAHQCKTPTLVPPTFGGVTTVTNSNQAAGFSQLTVNWVPVDASEAGLFSYYEIAYATTPSGQSWTSGTIQVTDRTASSRVVTGLTENTTYYFRVRAMNNNGTPSVSSGSDVVANGTTTPQAPTGDNLSAATSIGSTKAQLTYAPPSSDVNTGGLFNGVFLFVQAGTTSDVTSYRSSVEIGGVTNAEIGGTISAGKVTLSSVPALVRVPAIEITADQNNAYEIWGLMANQQVCIQALAVYWNDSQTTKFLRSITPTTRCVTPTAGAPTFAGVTGLSGFGDSRDFTQITVSWGAITGDCTGVEISATQTPTAPTFTTPAATATCGETSKTIAGLTPHKDYYIQVRALNVVSGTTYASGHGTELTRKTRPATPAGDGMTNAVSSPVSKALDTMALTYAEATSGVWNKTYIWRGTGSNQTAAENAVRTSATTKSDNTGPTSSPYIQKTAGNTTATDTAVNAGVYTCYLARAVYDDGSYYSASLNETIKCDRVAYTTPTFTGVASAAVVGTWSDGTAKIELTFNAAPAGSIEEYWVYYSVSSGVSTFGDLTTDPWQKIDFGDATFDSSPNDNKILVGGSGRTIAGDGYFIVRYKFYYGNDTDTNTSVAGPVSIASTQANFVHVPPSKSGLGYSYFMMQYEASLSSGSFQAGDAVAVTEADLATCNHEFHANKTAIHSTCGTHASSAVVKSVKSVSPVTANFHQAWMACRNSGTNGFPMRLATQEEWRRAAKWVGTSYQTMWDVYSNSAAGNCAVNAGGAANTGASSSCKSALDVYDVAGNLKEWVDTRMLRYDTTPEIRFSYAPMIGQTLKNGIENVSRRYHLIDPGTSGLALAMGADYTTPSLPDRKQYGSDVQTWIDPSTTTATGFRCVALIGTSMPAMSSLSLPAEPVFTSSDISGAASTWVIPENLYVKDARWESLNIAITGNTTDSVAEGKVNITWKPWAKTTCTPSCAAFDAMTYKVYRFVEPTLSSSRVATPWALAGGTVNPYSADKPLDPLAVDVSGSPLYTSSSTDGRLVGTITNCDGANLGNCTFEDSASAGTGFSTGKIYNYLLVAHDTAGNEVIGMVQRWRSPYLAGDPAVSGAATFRLEPRFRRAAVFLVDEAHQQAQTRPQIMVHVPMDQSGLDHDFFIQKYEASSYSGTVSNNSPAGASDWPTQGSTGTWSAKAGQCEDVFNRTAAFDVTACGNGTSVAATTTTVQSKQGTSPRVSIDQGAFWKACRNTGIADDDGNTYYLALPTAAEWLKASDWGDLNLDGTIDVNPVAGNVGASAAARENGAADAITVRCHTDNNPTSAYSSNDANTANCRSRYGAADMVGNVWEWTSEQIYNGVGYDNGVDGLWTAQNFPTSNQAISSLGRYDLVRALPKSAGAPAIVDNGDYHWYNAALRGAARGGDWFTTSNAGRWSLYVNIAPSYPATNIGGRCGG
jgi:formylglycine-generating enzyme required for sulfatase activity/fibronectin type 3 domain-containing protein